MFMCNITKMQPYARKFVYNLNYCLFANGDVSIRFSGKDDDSVLESKIIHRNVNHFDSKRLINKCIQFKTFSSGLILGGHDVTKTPPYTPKFVYREVLLICKR